MSWQDAYLHLGCGTKRLPPPWVNSDASQYPVVEGYQLPTPVDAVLDIHKDLAAIPDSSLAWVYWSHGPEHIAPDLLPVVFKQLHRAMKYGGKLTLATTSIEGIYQNRYLTAADGPYWSCALFGETHSTADPYASHKQCFSGPSLWQYLKDAGFDGMQAWHPTNYPDIHALRDYSTTAILVSILMEGFRA
jgi:hypothetical protein